MGFDLYSTQQSIKTYLEAQFPNYIFERGSVPDDESVRREDGKIVNYVVLRFRPMQPRGNGKSMMGARSDDYFSTVDVNVISANEDFAAQTLNVMVDRLIGFKPAGATQMIPEGGTGDIAIRNVSNKPTAYISSQRFTFGLNITIDPGFIPIP